MGAMSHNETPLQAEAKNPATTPERLDELTKLDGNRGDCDSDAGWCREFVANNPSTSAETLAELAQDADDFLVRLGAAKHPSTHVAVVAKLLADPNRQVVNAARARFELPQIPPEAPAEALSRRIAGRAGWKQS